jgi:hypothetical protein
MSKKSLLFLIVLMFIGAFIFELIGDTGRAVLVLCVAVSMVGILIYRIADEKPAPVRTMETPKHFDHTHFKAITIGGRKFVYCPVGNICSWSPGDYDNAWCHWCNKFFNEIGA